jgi:aryl-phospho-beta-D-glucosidase BglC (GH1 family)
MSANGGYTVSGATILDSTGKPHLFHGVGRPSLEWSVAGQWGSNNDIPASDFMLMATAWKANVVRISLNQDFWLSGAALHNAGYQATVQQAVTNAEAAGLDVILDLHWSDCGNLALTTLHTTEAPDNTGVSGQQVMADANSLQFWTEAATVFKTDPHVLFELYNEPNGIAGAEWLNGSGGATDSFGCKTVGMQQLYNAVRATGAQNLVIIGGLNYAFDLSVVKVFPVAGSNILYATHPYNEGGKDPSTWANAFGYLTATNPVIATEFGDITSDNCSSTYNSEVLAYVNKTGSNPPANQMSWTGYGWFVSSSGCTFPDLIANWGGTPTASGAVVQTALLAY